MLSLLPEIPRKSSPLTVSLTQTGIAASGALAASSPTAQTRGSTRRQLANI
ncbi:MAG: hypothetical protein U5K38_02255 [Woeseiaceae bacterium]|nr:hypothetical protein [Woeseiaceae bacterium]